jgi:CheY-like chemotaxis protein
MGTDRQTVLLVEDNNDIRSVMTDILEDEGYAAEPARGGREAIEKLSSDGLLPSLVLLDFTMPDVTGLDVLRVIRENDRLKSVPVLMMTAFSPSLVPDGVQCIPKPMDVMKLLGTIRECCTPGWSPALAAG